MFHGHALILCSIALLLSHFGLTVRSPEGILDAYHSKELTSALEEKAEQSRLEKTGVPSRTSSGGAGSPGDSTHNANNLQPWGPGAHRGMPHVPSDQSILSAKSIPLFREGRRSEDHPRMPTSPEQQERSSEERSPRSARRRSLQDKGPNNVRPDRAGSPPKSPAKEIHKSVLGSQDLTGYHHGTSARQSRSTSASTPDPRSLPRPSLDRKSKSEAPRASRDRRRSQEIAPASSPRGPRPLASLGARVHQGSENGREQSTTNEAPSLSMKGASAATTTPAKEAAKPKQKSSGCFGCFKAPIVR